MKTYKVKILREKKFLTEYGIEQHEKDLEELINSYANEGWRLMFYQIGLNKPTMEEDESGRDARDYPYHHLIFERDEN